MVAALLFAAAACSSDGEPGVDEEPVTNVGETGVGKCLRFGDDIGEQVTELPYVECTDEHTHEIFAVITSGEEVYPGFEALENTALTECVGQFEDYIGISPFDSKLRYSWLVPTLDSWNREDDRETLCVVGSEDGSSLSVPLAGSGG